MAAQDGGGPNVSGCWVDGYTAIYRYPYPWLMLVFPVFGLLGIVLAQHSGAALAVAIGAEAVFILVFFEWRTYYIEVSVDSIAKGSFLHRKAIPLARIDLVQHIYGGHGEQLLYIRHGDRILLTVSQDLDGFDDLVGFFREYARHHHLIFATRDDFGEWTQAGKSKTGDSVPTDE
jgi:hypothetical protein